MGSNLYSLLKVFVACGVARYCGTQTDLFWTDFILSYLLSWAPLLHKTWLLLLPHDPYGHFVSLLLFCVLEGCIF